MKQNIPYWVLIIEDSLVDQKMILEGAKPFKDQLLFSVATSIEEARTLLDSQTFDAAVLDFWLGDGNAMDAIKGLDNVPFIVLSGGLEEDIINKTHQEGAFHCIEKDTLGRYAHLLPHVILNAIRLRQSCQRLEYFEAAADHISDAIALVNYSTETPDIVNIESCNVAFSILTEYQQDEIETVNLFDLIETNDEVIKKKEQFLKGIVQEKYQKIVANIRSKSGAIYQTEINFIPYQHKAEPATSVQLILVLKNITQLNQLKERLQIAEDKARLAQKAEYKFLTNMSHEIRTPLNAMVGMAHLIKNEHLSEQEKEYLDAIVQAGDSLQRIISDILELSKLQSNVLETKEVPFNLSELIAEVEKKAITVIANKPLKFVKGIQPSLGLNWLGDQARIVQVLHYLISNAVKFTEQGQVGIRIFPIRPGNSSITSSTTPQSNDPQGHQWLAFEVFDTGIGIAERELAIIFNNFRHANADIHNKYGGVGLGLSVAKQLVEQLGGKISVNSTPQKGSTFTVELPLVPIFADQLNAFAKKAATPVQVIEKSQNPSTNSSNNKDVLQQIQVLVAEDNFMNQKLIAGVLKRWKCQFEIVENGKDAVAAFQKKHYDIILMDINMPIMDGYEATRAIRSSLHNNRNLPIIALTAAVFNAARTKAFEAGMNEYMAKPFHPNELKKVVLKLVNANKKTLIPASEETNQHSSKNLNTRSGEQESSSSMVTINFDYLKEFSGGDTAFMNEMVQMFLEQMPQEIVHLGALLEQESWQKLGKQAHKMKPNYLMMGMEIQRSMAKEIEQLCLASTINTHQVKTLTKQLMTDTKQVIPLIEQEISNA